MSEGFKIGVAEYHNHTLLHPVGLSVVLLQGVALLFLPRRYAIFPMMIVACFIPSAQRLAVMGLDFTLLRILILFAWVRLVARREFSGFNLNLLDTLIILWMFSGTVIYTFQQGSMSALIYRCGWMFDGLGMYFFFRCVIRVWEDFDRLVQGFALLRILVAMAFVVESRTGRNVFSMFGGVPEITMVREGRLRCQGAFAHPILAGCFWASIIPWMVSYISRGHPILGSIGIGCATLIVVACSSSTPLLALIFVGIALLLYFVRYQLRYIRWCFAGVLIVLHFVREKPVWHLLSRINVVGGSTGWHRYIIMDATINNFSKWWLLGEANVMSWGVWQMQDVTNQYILEALLGGLLALVLFISCIVVGFRMVGRALCIAEADTAKRMVVWSAGSALFVHVCIYFAVSYFGQIIMLWYLTLAIIGSLNSMLLAGEMALATTTEEIQGDVNV